MGKNLRSVFLRCSLKCFLMFFEVFIEMFFEVFCEMVCYVFSSFFFLGGGLTFVGMIIRPPFGEPSILKAFHGMFSLLPGF